MGRVFEGFECGRLLGEDAARGWLVKVSVDFGYFILFLGAGVLVNGV